METCERKTRVKNDDKIVDSADGRFMLSLSEMGRSEGGSSVGDKLQLGFGHETFEVPVGHPRLLAMSSLPEL